MNNIAEAIKARYSRNPGKRADSETGSLPVPGVDGLPIFPDEAQYTKDGIIKKKFWDIQRAYITSANMYLVTARVSPAYLPSVCQH